jgi:hypothetical protein
MHSVGIESKTEGLMAEFTKLQDRCKKDRDTCPGENYDSEASQPRHRFIIAPDEKQWRLLSRDACFAVPVEECAVPQFYAPPLFNGLRSCDLMPGINKREIANALNGDGLRDYRSKCIKERSRPSKSGQKYRVTAA